MTAGTVVNKAFCNHDRVKLWLAILSLYQNTSCFDTTQNLIDSYSKSKIFLNFILAVFVLSIPFKNAIYQASVILLIGFFVVDFLLNRKFEALLSVVKEAKFLAIGFSFIMLSMILANILNINYLDKKSWHLVYMFFFRYALVFYDLGLLL
jgi:O-antigen ligase